jgi:hypothetical protein
MASLHNVVHVIVLAGGAISNKLTFLHSRCESPALIPVNTRPLAAYLIDFYAAEPDAIVHVLVNEAVADTVRAELGLIGDRCHLLTVATTSGVVDSLAQAMASLPAAVEVIVNLVTTVPTQLAQRNEVLLAFEHSQSVDWSGVLIDSAGPRFFFKQAPSAEPSHAFTGIFRCAADDLRAALATTDATSDLLAVVESLERVRPSSFVPTSWIDCGHEINYYNAKARLITSRSFNRVQVSPDEGVVRKSSEDSEKLRREINYLGMLPPPLRIYFPRVLPDGPVDAGSTSITMEYYGYPTVAEYLLYWDLSPDHWRRLFSRLQSVLARFAQFPHTIDRATFEEFYLDKTTQRIGTFLGALDPEVRRALESESVINGRRYRPFHVIEPELRRRLSAAYHAGDFCVMHGDYCFNNILYDMPTGIVRLIDPRGSFGERCVGVYGDRKYDAAKLNHSAAHGYDFLVNGLFTLRYDAGHIDYSIATRDCSPMVRSLVQEAIEGLGLRYADIELLTSLLFLSMCSLHTEAPGRQLTMYAHGLQLLNRCLED